MSNGWYESVEATRTLMQGDFILDCPVVAWRDQPIEFASGQEAESLKVASQVIVADVIVMTQACDLENEKVSNVILCPHYTLSAYKKLWEVEMGARGQNPNTKAWKGFCDDVKDGFQWNLAMLNEDDDMKAEHRIVDFHEVFTAPRVFLESLLKGRTHGRLRLLPPYREHLSQAFARFFMRVGLPSPITKAW
jgi:hypothetical protein